MFSHGQIEIEQAKHLSHQEAGPPHLHRVDLDLDLFLFVLYNIHF